MLALAVARTWQHRAQLEREATLRFARLADQLTTIGAAPDVIALARRGAEDEARHAGICSELASRFGPPVTPTPATLREIAPQRLELRDRVLYEVVAFACVSESINVALLLRTLDVATDEAVRTAVHALVTDEVAHSRFGWAHLRYERAAGRGDFLAGLLPPMLDGTVSDEIFGSDDDDGPAALALGNLPRAMRRDVLRESLESVVLAGLDSLGVDVSAARAWMTSRFG